MMVWEVKGQIVMTLDELKEVVDTLTREERQHLQEYINLKQAEEKRTNAELKALLRAFEEIREGLTDEEFAEIEEAMNGKPV